VPAAAESAAGYPVHSSSSSSSSVSSSCPATSLDCWTPQQLVSLALRFQEFNQPPGGCNVAGAGPQLGQHFVCEWIWHDQ
jgi:hypothetical protein